MRSAQLVWIGILFAIAAGILLLAGGVHPAVSVLVLALWLISLWVLRAKPEVRPVPVPRRTMDIDRMSDLFENSDMPVLVTRRDRIVMANASARNLFGAHVLEQDIRMALRHPEAVRLVESKVSGGVVIGGMIRRHDVWRINRKLLDGDLGVIEFTNRTAEADISRAHTDFVANASHELRTPLAAIIGYVETLREDDGNLDGPLADKFLATIMREAQRLQGLVSDLMSLSRIEAEKHDVPTEEIALAPLVERAAVDAAGVEARKRITLDLDPGPMVRGDTHQLEQLVRNLVDNALKYGRSDKSVEVILERSGDERAAIIVRDHGDGIAPEHLPHLTRRFYRTDPGRSRASGGTGLGLAIVKHVVERHRGRLTIDSKLGEGTTVRVVLPTEN